MPPEGVRRPARRQLGRQLLQVGHRARGHRGLAAGRGGTAAVPAAASARVVPAAAVAAVRVAAAGAALPALLLLVLAEVGHAGAHAAVVRVVAFKRNQLLTQDNQLMSRRITVSFL